jgi:cell division protein FtsB
MSIGSIRRKLLSKPTVIGFIILFGFNFYGLRQNSNTSEANRRTAAVQAEKNKEIATAQTKLATDNAKLAQKEAYDNCNGINESRRSSVAAAQRLAAAQIGQAQGLKDRFVQANTINPPTTGPGLQSYAAGNKFFDDLIHDTKMRAEDAVKALEKTQSISKCTPPAK